MISSPDGKSKVVELEADKAKPLLGRKLGEILEGSLLGMEGQKLKIAGGSDSSGFPMRSDVHGSAKKDVILSGGVGHHPKRKGERRRKYVRGNTVTDDIVQLNLVAVVEEKKV